MVERNEPKQNPTATLTVGIWTIAMETRRIKMRTERDVHLSDNPTGHGNGTLLRTEKHCNRMTVHRVDITSGKGDHFAIQVTQSGQRTSYTRTNLVPELDIDLKPKPCKPQSYTLKQATDLLCRILGIDAKTAAVAILTPLDDVEIAPVSTTARTMQEA